MADSPIDPQDLHRQEGGHVPAVGDVITPQDAMAHDLTPHEDFVVPTKPVQPPLDYSNPGDTGLPSVPQPSDPSASRSSGESQGPVPSQEAVSGDAVGRIEGVPAGVETHTTDETTSDPA